MRDSMSLWVRASTPRRSPAPRGAARRRALGMIGAFFAGASLAACQGAHAQAGPVIAFPLAGGVSYGWELGAGELGLVRLSTGGIYNSAKPPEPDEPPEAGLEERSVHYLALEPLGLSIGFDWGSHGGGVMGGAWAGWFVNPGDEFGTPRSSPSPFAIDIDCPGSSGDQYDVLGSAALGIRYLGGEWEV